MQHLYLTLIIISGTFTSLSGQWTNEPETVHSGTAQLNDPQSSYYITSLLTSSPGQTNTTGIEFDGQIVGGANRRIEYVYSDNQFAFGNSANFFPAKPLKFNMNGSDVSLNTYGIISIGNTDMSHLSIDQNEIQAKRGIDINQPLFINRHGGDVSIGVFTNPARLYYDESAGSIGIGTTMPQAKLHIVSTQADPLRFVNISAGTDSKISFYNDQTENGSIVFNTLTRNIDISNEHNGEVNLGSNDQKVLTFAAGGRLGIGTENPVATLDIRGNFMATGELTAASDIRLKENIEPVVDATSIIQQLKPMSYEYKSEEYQDMGLTEGKRWGLIAQDVEKVLPELVSSNHEDNQSFKSVNYIDIIAILIKLHQEQLDLLAQLEEKRADLESRMDLLEIPDTH